MSTYVYYLPASAQCRYFLNEVGPDGSAMFRVVEGETSDNPNAYNLAPFHPYTITLQRTEKVGGCRRDWIVTVEKGPYQFCTATFTAAAKGGIPVSVCSAGDCEPNLNCPSGTRAICDSTGVTKCIPLGAAAEATENK